MTALASAIALPTTLQEASSTPKQRPRLSADLYERGKQISAARKARGQNPTEFSARNDIRYKALLDAENGVPIHRGQMRRIAQAIGCDLPD